MMRLKSSGKKEHIILGCLKRENTRLQEKQAQQEIIESFGENDKFEHKTYRTQNKSLKQDEKDV